MATPMIDFYKAVNRNGYGIISPMPAQKTSTVFKIDVLFARGNLHQSLCFVDHYFVKDEIKI
jgi:hypothetical protein